MPVLVGLNLLELWSVLNSNDNDNVHTVTAPTPVRIGRNHTALESWGVFICLVSFETVHAAVVVQPLWWFEHEMDTLKYTFVLKDT